MVTLKLVKVLTLLSLSLAGCSRQVPSNVGHSDVSTGEAAKMIASDKRLVIVDVREVSEYSGKVGYVPGAVNYPWTSGYLRDNYQQLDKSKDILVVCRSGRRSEAAASFLSSKGYLKVYNMLGGTNQWIRDGHKTEKLVK